MKRQALSYSLLFLFLFVTLVSGQTQEELTRLPILWKHYQTHKAKAPISFPEYLQLHYGKDFAQHSLAHDHSGLPMKSGDNHLHAPVPIDLPRSVEMVQQAILIGNKTVVSKDQIVQQSFLYDIWQPPRNC